MAHIRQSRSDSGLGFQLKDLKNFDGIASSLKGGAEGHGGGGVGTELRACTTGDSHPYCPGCQATGVPRS